MRGVWAFSGDSRKYAIISWSRGIAVFVIVLCVSLLTQGRAVAIEESLLEECDAECSLALAHELAHAYDQNNPRAIEYLHNYFDEKINILFESGDLEQVVRLVQIVTPSAAKWAASREPTLRHLAEWQTLEALAHNELPTRIASARPIAKDEMPLLISVKKGTPVQIYRSANGNESWIGQTPQHVILSPGLTRLFLDLNVCGSDTCLRTANFELIVGLTVSDGRVRVNDLRYKIDNPDATDKFARARLHFITSLRRRYPASSVLQPKNNGLPSFELPIIVWAGRTPTGTGAASGGPLDWGRANYRKIKIESDPTGASILINGHPRGTTPQAIVSQDWEIRMILSKPGYLENASEIKLTEPVTAIHANLNPIP